MLVRANTQADVGTLQLQIAKLGKAPTRRSRVLLIMLTKATTPLLQSLGLVAWDSIQVQMEMGCRVCLAGAIVWTATGQNVVVLQVVRVRLTNFSRLRTNNKPTAHGMYIARLLQAEIVRMKFVSYHKFYLSNTNGDSIMWKNIQSFHC